MQSTTFALFRRSFISAAIMTALTGHATAGLHFDPAMLSGQAGQVADLSRFENGTGQLPGRYQVDVYLNGHQTGTRELDFKDAGQEKTHDQTGLTACLTKKDFAALGVNVAAFPALRDRSEAECIRIGQYIPQAFTAFNFQTMRVDISIPQAALVQQARGWISPERWDNGINAALLSWQLSGSENRGTYGNSSSHYLYLKSGLNLGAWRLRDNSTWNDSSSRYSHQQRWSHLNTYVQRAIIPWRSELTAGDSTTGSDVFDALSFRGVQLASDDNMVPDSRRGFAPVVQGIATSNAQVSIRQNGNKIYETYVAPGAFTIRDLSASSSGGDLEVTITEADGTRRVFTQSYSSVPMLQRQGRLRYGLTAGRYRSTSDRYSAPSFAQGTLLLGLPYSTTVYGGTQIAENYTSAALGLGVNMGAWGAVSADVTQARSVLADGSRHQGQSVRFQYGRTLQTTGTSLQLAGYRYSTQGFHTLDETALKRMSGWYNDETAVDAAGRPVRRNWSDYFDLYSNKRQRMQISLSQRISDSGSLYLQGNHQTYWKNRQASDSFQAGYNGSVSGISYSLSYGYSRSEFSDRPDRTLALAFSVPLDFGHKAGDITRTSRFLRANYGVSRDTDGHLSHRAGLSGTALEGNNLDWSLSQGYDAQDRASGDADLNYRGGYGTLSGGYGYSRDYKVFRYGAAGGAVLHSGGLTAGQPLGETNVLVAAPGAAGVPLENQTGVRTDGRGYTVVPYASVYRENRIALDVRQLGDNTEIDNTVASVVPTQGAIVRAAFSTHTGARGMMTLLHNGKPLPFGSQVKTADGFGLVDDQGQVYLSGLRPAGTLTASWGAGDDQRCVASYQLPQGALAQPMFFAQVSCP